MGEIVVDMKKYKKHKNKCSIRNVVKNKVKDCQRALDYKSPYGVKFWNRLLKLAKERTKNRKATDESLAYVIEWCWADWNKKLIEEKNKEDGDNEVIEMLTKKLELLEPFTNEEWRKIPSRQEVLDAERARKKLEKERDNK